MNFLIMCQPSRTLFKDSISVSPSSVSRAACNMCNIGYDLGNRGFAINVSKSSAMAFLLTPSDVHVSFDSVTLDTESTANLLGVIIDNKFAWDEHISFGTDKVARKIAALQSTSALLSQPERRRFGFQ